MRTRKAENGRRTLYVEHGVWVEDGRIHVTLDQGGSNAKASHWSYGRDDPRFDRYLELLRSNDRDV